MRKFEEFKKYIISTNTNKEKRKFEFYKVGKDEIESIQTKYKINFPMELNDFYNEIGYGFVRPDKSDLHDFTNRIMSPIEIVYFLNGLDIYENDERRNYYLNKNRLPFYEVSENSLLTIDLQESKSDNKCKVYYYNIKIANSLLEFLEKMKIEADYYIEDDEDDE